MKNIQAHILYAICENVPDAICLVDTDWNIQSWNKGAEVLFGYTVDEITGKNLAVIIPEEIAQKEIDHCRHELNTKGKMSAYQTVRRAKDGRVIPIELTAVALKEDGAITSYASIMRDITERKRFEHEITESEASLRTIFNSSNDAISVHDLSTGKILEVNEKFYELYEYTPEEIPGLDVGSLSSGTAGYTNAGAQRLLKKTAEGEPQFFEWMAKSKTGRLFQIEVHLRRVSLKGTDRILATVRDISERKQAEESLRLTQFSMDHASVCAYLVGRDARFLYVNEQTCRMLGYSREELLSMAVYDLDPDYPISVWDDHWALLKKEGSLHFETHHRRKDGSFVPVEMSLNYLSFGGREYNVAFGVDISERKKTEQELAKISRQNELILESAGEGIFGMDSRGHYIFINSAGKRMLGYDADELMGRHSHPVWHHTRADGTPYPEDECGIYKTAQDGISRHVDDEVFWKRDGTPLPVEYTTTPICEGSTIVGAVVTFRDITERKRTREALQRAYADLEMKVEERTRELVKINEELRMEVTERRRAVETIRKSKELSDALNKLDTVIHSTLDLDEIMQRVVEEAARAMNVDATMIGVFEGDIFRIRYVYIMPGKFTWRTLTPNELKAIHHAALAEDALAFNDAFNDERLNIPFVREVGIRSLLVAPLFIKKKIAGAMSFYGLSRQIIFEEEDIDFARKVSASVSLALENARLYQAMRENERRLKAILSSIPDMAWLKDKESRFILVNESFTQSSGKSAEDLIGKTDFDVWPKDLAERYLADDRDVVTSRMRKRVEEPLAAQDGTVRWIETIKTPIYNEEGEVMGTAGIARDITDRKRMEEEIMHLALHDSLTGLPNRRLFKDILNVELAQARRNRNKAAVLFLDLDRFKEINDTLGHDAGDLLLKEVGGRIKASIRESDTVARIGGDEFNIIVPDISLGEAAAEVARKIIDSLKRPLMIAGRELNITTSIGISVFPDDSIEQETLLAYADIALYYAKERGRNQYRFYNPVINKKSLERMRFESSLRQALDRDEFVLHYQPQVDLGTGRMIAAEALVRWNHPEKGLMEPASFIPAAEEIGLISSIDEWVLRTACSQVRDWADAGLRRFSLTVNLSAREFQNPDLAKNISRILMQTGLDPECLNIELTENTAMSNMEHTVSMLNELAGMGVHITIDDFGTGYSSLNYLKRLPIERLKIDKSFVQEIATDPEGRGVIHAVAAMAHSMKLKVAAGGVETQGQLAFLRESRCDEAQGYLFSRPVPAEKFRKLVMTGGSR